MSEEGIDRDFVPQHHTNVALAINGRVDGLIVGNSSSSVPSSGRSIRNPSPSRTSHRECHLQRVSGTRALPIDRSGMNAVPVRGKVFRAPSCNPRQPC